MANRTGVYVDSALGVTQDPFITVSLDTMQLNALLDRPVLTTDGLDGVHSEQPSSTYTPEIHTGFDAVAYFEDLYNRIHIIPNSFDFGTLLAIDVRNFEVWNAFVTTGQLLNAITGPTVLQSGVTVTSGTLPIFLYQLESRPFTITADIAGPADINFTFTFDFDSYTDLDITTTGVRISIWGEIPQNNWKEIYEWKTDVIEAYSGKKQYIALRDQPRVGLTHNYSSLTNLERGRVINKLRSTISNNYAVPMWSQFKKLQANVLIGETVVYIDTAQMDIEVDSFLLLWTNDTSYEAVVISEIHADHLILVKGVENSYYINNLAIPLILCYLPSEVSHNLSLQNKTDYSIGFKTKPGVDIQTGNLPDSYDNGTDDLDIMIDQSLAIGKSTKQGKHIAKRKTIDNMTGDYIIDYSFNYAINVHNITRRFYTRNDIWNFRAWLQKMKGKQGTFWFPEFSDTMFIVGNIADTSSIVKIQNINLTDLYNGTPFVTDLFIILNDGTRIFRKISSVGKNGSDEDILLTATVGTAFTDSDVYRIGILHKVGIASDNIVLNFHRDGFCDVTFNVEEVLQ